MFQCHFVRWCFTSCWKSPWHIQIVEQGLWRSLATTIRKAFYELANEGQSFGSELTLCHMRQDPTCLWIWSAVAYEEHFSIGWGINFKCRCYRVLVYLLALLPPYSPFFPLILSERWVPTSFPCHVGLMPVELPGLIFASHGLHLGAGRLIRYLAQI